MTRQPVTDAAPAQAEPASCSPTGPGTAARVPAACEPPGEALVADELLIEEVSIDGMCGVY